MCGRLTLRSSPQVIAEVFGLAESPQLSPHFNIAPSQSVAVVRQQPESHGRELALLHWGLIPFWADDPSIGDRMANARSETAATKPSFSRAFRSRRCLVVANGFYEWQKTDGKKQPYYVRLKNDRPFGLAGLWECWDKQGTPIESCTILTTDANELMMPIHESVSGRSKPASEGRLKTSHFEETQTRRLGSGADLWPQEPDHGESAQDGRQRNHSYTPSSRLVPASHCRRTGDQP
jgi:putative SOS response-associated peptidase YedK